MSDEGQKVYVLTVDNGRRIWGLFSTELAAYREWKALNGLTGLEHAVSGPKVYLYEVDQMAGTMIGCLTWSAWSPAQAAANERAAKETAENCAFAFKELQRLEAML